MGLEGESAEAVHEALRALNPQDESEVPGTPLRLLLVLLVFGSVAASLASCYVCTAG